MNHNAASMNNGESSFNNYLQSMGYPPNYSLKCHGKDFAFEIKPDVNKVNWHTVRLESAARMQGQQAYDWKNKIALQLTREELPLATAFFLTLSPQIECKYHGPQNSKGFIGHFQKDSVFASLQEAQKPKMGVRMSFEDSMMFGHLCLAQYCFNFPNISSETALQSIKLMSNRKMKS